MKLKLNILIFLSVLAVLLSSCGDNNTQSGTKKKPNPEDILGAGATFPYPLYSKMFDNYFKQSGKRINYQAIGSGAGIKQMVGRTVDFGATDAFMNEKELKNAKAPVIHIPTAMGAVAVIYNVPGLHQVNLNADVITKLYTGQIKYWNDYQIQNLNPNVKLPKNPVLVVGRSDGSGTTFVFTDFLSKASPEWKEKLGKAKSVKWPTGIAGNGNPGVAGIVKQTPGAIGYVELEYAIKNKLQVASIQNKAGKFVQPSIETVTLAANAKIPADTRVSIANTDAPDGYPISTFTWLIFFKEQNYNNKNADKVKSMLELFDWMITDGQSYHKKLNYAPLPEKVVEISRGLLRTVTFSGKQILDNLE